MIRSVVLVTSFIFAQPCLATPGPTPQVINLTSVTTSDLDKVERLNRKSASLPLTLESLEKLAKAGIKSSTIIEMMRTRGVLALANTDALLRLKAANASDEMIAALSAFAVKPNDHFILNIRMDVRSAYSVKFAPYLYIEVWNPRKNRQEAFMYTDLRNRFSNRGAVAVMKDRSDPLLPNTIKSVSFSDRVRTRDAGPLEIRVSLSQKAGLMALNHKKSHRGAEVKTFKFEYPSVSLERRCKLELSADRDTVIKDHYSLKNGRLECRWD
jgi:hypothetical protein